MCEFLSSDPDDGVPPLVPAYMDSWCPPFEVALPFMLWWWWLWALEVEEVDLRLGFLWRSIFGGTEGPPTPFICCCCC